MNQERVENQLTWSAKSPLTLLHQRGVKPPFTKGRSGGIYGDCPENYEVIIMKAKGTEKIAADCCKSRNLRRVLGR